MSERDRYPWLRIPMGPDADSVANAKDMAKIDAETTAVRQAAVVEHEAHERLMKRLETRPMKVDFCEHGRQPIDGHEKCGRPVDLVNVATSAIDWGHGEKELPRVRPCYVCDADTGVTREGVPMCIKCRS